MFDFFLNILTFVAKFNITKFALDKGVSFTSRMKIWLNSVKLFDFNSTRFLHVLYILQCIPQKIMFQKSMEPPKLEVTHGHHLYYYSSLTTQYQQPEIF